MVLVRAKVNYTNIPKGLEQRRKKERGRKGRREEGKKTGKKDRREEKRRENSP